jgi:hypothetical protein
MKKYIILFCLWLSGISIANAQIVAGEYFWDTDPGVGLATALTVPEIASGVGDESFALNITTPNTAGQHVLFVRFKQNDTLWSQAYPQMLLVGSENLLTGSTTLVDSSKIVQVDYYWNDSTANVHTVALATPTDQFLSAANIGTSGLTGGQHVLNIRVKDKYGLYSPYSKELVFISPENHLAGATDQVDSLEMKEIEFYWNLETNTHATIWLAPSDESFNFTINFPTAGAQKGANQLYFRFKDKYGLYSPWQSESILIMGRQSGELAKVDSIRYALSGYSYVGTPPNDFLNVNFNVADTLKRDSFDSDIIGSKEIPTTGLSHGVHVMTFKVFGSTLLDSSIVSSKNSHFYQTMVKVDNTIEMNVGTPTLVNGTVSNEFCPGGSMKIPIDTTGNWPDETDYGIPPEFTVKIKNVLGQFLTVPSAFNSTGDSLIVTIPTDWLGSHESKIMVEANFPLVRDTVAGTFKIGNSLSINTSTPVVCVDQTIHLVVSSALNATYSWSGPGAWTSTTSTIGQSSTASRVASPTSGGFYTVTVTSAIAGCVNTGTVNVTVNPLPVITLGSNAPVCQGQNINLTSSAIGNSFLGWARGNVNIGGSGGNKTVSSVALADSGFYKVSYMSPASCIKIDSIKVIVKPLPVLSGVSTNAPICSGNTLTFGLNASPGSTYSWTGPNSFSSTTEDQSISSASTSASGTYSVAVTLNGCVVNTTIVNVVNQTPTANTTTPVVICENQSLSLAVNNTPSATYLWSGPFFAAAGQNPLVSNTATVGMSGTYSVTVTLGSCNASNTVAVTVKPLPIISGTNTNSPICSGNNLNFGIDATAASTYSWTGPNGFTSALEDPNISSAATSGSGTYSVTVSLNGCNLNTTVVNVVNLTPTVSTISPMAICQGAALTLNVNNTPSATYGWSGPSGFSSIIEDPLVSNTATVGMSGTYSVTVSLGSCSANGTIAVTVNPNPVLVITNQNTTGNGPVNITVPAATAGSTLPPSTSLSYFTNSLATNVLASPIAVANSGTYFIKATSPAGCIDVKPIVVNICGSTFNLVSPTDDYNSGIQVKASTVKITASNKITGTANITYRSAQAIELNPGFLTANGTVFLAEKGLCN